MRHLWPLVLGFLVALWVPINGIGGFSLGGIGLAEGDGLVSVFIAEVIAFLKLLVGSLDAILRVFASAINAAFQIVGHIFQKIAAALHHLWENGLKRLIGGLLGWIRRAARWLEIKLRPIIDFLKRMRQAWDRYYRLHILPLINLLQRIRRWLLLLRLLHIGFAKKLDSLLLNYEVRLNKIFLDVRGYINLALNWASLATNPVSLGRLVLVSVAGRRATAALVRAVTGLPVGHFFPSTARNRFPFEQQPVTSQDYLDPTRNPPASQILAPLLDGFSEGSFSEAPGPADVDIDAVEHLAWGDEVIQDLLTSEAAFAALDYNGLSLIQALESKSGDLYNAGQGGATAALTQTAAA